MDNVFEINGYWKDSKDEFSYLVKESHDYNDDEDGLCDEDVFMFGVSEKDIQRLIAEGENSNEDFIVLSYQKV